MKLDANDIVGNLIGGSFLLVMFLIVFGIVGCFVEIATDGSPSLLWVKITDGRPGYYGCSGHRAMVLFNPEGQSYTSNGVGETLKVKTRWWTLPFAPIIGPMAGCEWKSPLEEDEK